MSERIGLNPISYISRILRRRNSTNPAQSAADFYPEYVTHELPVRNFNLPPEVKASLNSKEQEFLEKATRAVETLGTLYSTQEGKGPRATFYPKDATKQEIQEAAKNNPEILSHYTVVRRDETGALVPVPMHKEYESAIEENKLYQNLVDAAQAAQRSGDTWSYMYLRQKADSFKTGNHKQPEFAWMDREGEPLIDIVIGFYDDYTDNFLKVKYAWEGWVDVLDKELTEDSQSFLNSFTAWASENTEVPRPKIKMRVGHTRITSGQAAKYRWQGNSLPCPVEWRQEMGSKFIIFEPVLEDKFSKRVLPTYKSSIDPNRRVGVQDAQIRTAQMRNLIGHEASHSFIPAGTDKRLENFHGSLKELFCNLLSIQGYAYMPGEKDRISDKERETALGLLFSEGVLDYIDFNTDHARREYYIASSTMLTFCLKRGNISIENNRITWENPRKVVSDLHILFGEVDALLKNGNVRKAKKFFGENCDPQAYRPVVFKESTELPYDFRIGPANSPVPVEKPQEPYLLVSPGE